MYKAYQEKILDGRNHWLACEETGVEPECEPYVGDRPVSYVISKNLHRRHLNKSQCAMIATGSIPMLEEEAKKRMTAGINQYSSPRELIPQGKATDLAGELFNVSGRYVSEAEKIKREAPEFVEPIIQGEMIIAGHIK